MEWTADDLIAEAAREGLSASRRLLRDWVELGLIDRPLVRGRGPRAGVAPGVWDDEQRQLLVALLRQRQHNGVQRVALLCSFPVSAWLIWGDAYAPLRQVRRAHRTWALAARSPTRRGAAAGSRSTTTLLSHADAGRRSKSRFRDLIQRTHEGEDVRRAALVAITRQAFDPAGNSQPRGPKGAELSPAVYADNVAWIRAGVDAVTGEADVPDVVYEEARQLYRQARSAYAREWRSFAADPELGHLHPLSDLEELVNAACRDLTLLIGVLLTVGSGP